MTTSDERRPPATALTSDVLTPVLREHIDAGLDIRSVSRAPAGNGQETWFVDAATSAGAKPLVLRRSAAAGPLRHTDRRVEADVMEAVAGTGLPVPTVHFVQPDATELDRPYLVMERLPGRPPRPRTQEEATSLARQLGTLLGRLHTADVAIPDALRGERPAAATKEQLRVWRQRYESDRPGPTPIIGALLAWLETRVPDSGTEPVLLWGDAGPHNVLTGDDRITALLDWELSHAGDPLEDLGAAVWACLGMYPSTEVVAGYEEVVGHRVGRDELNYYTAMCSVTRCVMQLAGVDAYVAGRTHEPNLAGLGLGLHAASLRRAAACAGWPRVSCGDTPPRRSSGRNDAQHSHTGSAADELRLRPDVQEMLAGVAEFLDTDVVADGSDRRVIRGVKTAAALLRTAERRVTEEAAARAESDRRLGELADRVSRAGLPRPHDAATLEQVAETVERDNRYTALRTPVRRFLLTDLTDRAACLSPLHDLYGATLATPEATQ